jgi:hypothetical protein
MKKPHPFHIHVPTWPVDLWAKLRRLASVSRRPIKEEALIAIEEHLKANDLLNDKEIEELRKARESDVH